MTRRLSLLLAVTALACRPAGERQEMPAGPEPGSREWKVQNAMSAAPTAVAGQATIMDWPATEGAQFTELRAGSNGWTCFPDVAATPGNDPMCVDQNFMAWATAWMSKTRPQITAVGFAYMLQGGSDASNTDPFKMAPDPGQPWVDTGSHLMMVVPDPASLDGLPADYRSGLPYVMWAGTPYAHVMLPVK